MLVIDDILLFPFRGLMFVFHEIQNAAQEDAAGEADLIRTELRELYMMLETGRIAEEEFDTREKELLDRLDETEGPAQNTQSTCTMADK